jgi:hypothetical protein
MAPMMQCHRTRILYSRRLSHFVAASDGPAWVRNDSLTSVNMPEGLEDWKNFFKSTFVPYTCRTAHRHNISDEPNDDSENVWKVLSRLSCASYNKLSGEPALWPKKMVRPMSQCKMHSGGPQQSEWWDDECQGRAGRKKGALVVSAWLG